MKYLLALPALTLLLAGCGTPATFSDGYVTANFVTNPANQQHGTVVAPGVYVAVQPTSRCAWDAQNLRTGERANHYASGGYVILGEDYWLQSTGCGEWQELEENEL